MHPMRQPWAKAALPFFLVALVLGSPAAAELIRPEHTPNGPEITGSIAGTQTHTYDPAAQNGRFEASATPYLLTVGRNAGDEADILPDEDGVRSQVVRLILDETGRLMDDPANAFIVRGTVTWRGQTYRGVLLRGTPTAFGADLGASNAFELNLSITGGAIAHLFGPDAYVRLRTAGMGVGEEGFARSFQTKVEESTLTSLHAPRQAPPAVAEPTAVAILLACGSWFFVRCSARHLAGRQWLASRLS